MRTVSRLSIAPVKSMELHHPDHVRLETWGARGDRSLYLVDPVGRLFTRVKVGPLVQVGVELDEEKETLRLTLPGGERPEGRIDLDGGEHVVTDFYGRPIAGTVVRGPWAEALSRFAGTPVRLVRPDQPGGATDVWPLSLMSTASVEELVRQSGSPEPGDSRRFRMLIEVDGCEPHEEDTWIGGRVRVGGALIGIPGAIPRCLITTQNPSTGLRDFPTLKEIKNYRGVVDKTIQFGVYGEVLEPGTVRIGDPVEPVEQLGGPES
jgi:uncharacterized protein